MRLEAVMESEPMVMRNSHTDSTARVIVHILSFFLGCMCLNVYSIDDIIKSEVVLNKYLRVNHHYQSSRNSSFIFFLLRASFSSRSRSSPRMRYMMKRVTPTYQAINIMPYIHILALTDLDFILGQSSSAKRCLAQNYSTEGMGPPVLKSRFLTVCPLKFFFYVCSLGGKMRVVSNLLNTLRNDSLSLFISTINITLLKLQPKQYQESWLSARLIFTFMWSAKALSIAEIVKMRLGKLPSLSSFKYFSTFFNRNLPIQCQRSFNYLQGYVSILFFTFSDLLLLLISFWMCYFPKI